jgi:YggT family protein
MFALAYLLEALASILDMVLNLYTWIIIVRALLTWVNPDPYNPIVRFLYNITEPVLGWVRRHVPVVFGGLDLSFVAVLLALYFLRLYVVRVLLHLAQSFG